MSEIHCLGVGTLLTHVTPSGNRAVVANTGSRDNELMVTWQNIPSEADISDFNDKGAIEVSRAVSLSLYPME